MFVSKSPSGRWWAMYLVDKFIDQHPEQIYQNTALTVSSLCVLYNKLCIFPHNIAHIFAAMKMSSANQYRGKLVIKPD